MKVRWRWRSRFRGRQSGVATLLPKDNHSFRLYKVQWQDGTIGFVRSNCLEFQPGATTAMKKEQQLKVAIKALYDIIDPIRKLLREMPEGHGMDGVAASQWAKTAGPEIAREALRKMGFKPK